MGAGVLIRTLSRLSAVVVVGGLLVSLAPPARAAERTYYIAADEVVWDYAPSYPDNPLTGELITKKESVYLRSAKNRIGRQYLKAVYREYTDASFGAVKSRGPDEEHLGILGPIIHAEVGDTITVVFRNHTRLPVGIHPHGVFYDKTSEGAHYMTASAATTRTHGGAAMPQTGADVPPGGEYVYHWAVPERAGPGPSDPDSVAWLYHAHDHESVDIYAGLVGAIIVTRADSAKPDGRPKDIDREFVTLFMIFDENASPYLDANIRRFVSGRVQKKDPDFIEANKKHAINGRLYGNLGGLTMKRGERVRWYVISLGNEPDIHTAHWHGNTALSGGARVDTVHVFPATTDVVDMQPDNVGVWLFHCHVADHMAGGMMTRYAVTE
ncbi:MAG TPA: multicopper oxidase domain-containing protein [Stellaceae bacterium]|nr:multicopper oxidase domain-containing protein [Stellaceae bacterium]